MATSTFKREEIIGVGSLNSVQTEGGVVGRITRASDEHYILKTIYLKYGNYCYPLPNAYASVYTYEPNSTTTEIYVATNQSTYIDQQIYWTLELDKMRDS